MHNHINIEAPDGYHRSKELARETGQRIPDLLALARNNDPFIAGSPAQLLQAEWFTDLWERFCYTTGVHLRRIHYQLFSQHHPLRHDGKPYENTEECWDYVVDAAKFARHLHLVPANAFEDHRNPDPQLF